MEVYLDNAATTKVYPQVLEQVSKSMAENYGNPSSMHSMGFRAEREVYKAKQTIGDTIKADVEEVYFTSGGTGSDNMAIIGTASALKRIGKRIITSEIEHPAVMESFSYLKQLGYEVVYIPVDSRGIIDLEALKSAVNDETILLSLMHTNNEVGSLQPIGEAASILKKANPKAIMHVDAVQGYGKTKIVPKNLGVDLMSVSGHKIHGPKGVGFLYVKRGTRLSPIVFGGGQQKGLRSGTENTPGISGLAEAAGLTFGHKENWETMGALSGYLLKELAAMDMVIINSPTERENRACHIVNASFMGIRGEVMVHALEEKGIYVSSGSACASNKPSPSHTLTAMGKTKEEIESAIRFSISCFTTKEELDYTLEILKELIGRLRRFKRK